MTYQIVDVRGKGYSKPALFSEYEINGVVPSNEDELITLIEGLIPFQKVVTSTDVTDKLDEILQEAQNDDNLSELILETPDGTVVIRTTQIADNRTKTTVYELQDGTMYSGDISLLKPYSRQIIQSKTQGCSNGTPYTLFQFRDADNLNLVIASFYRNDQDLSESLTQPPNWVIGECKEDFIVTLPSISVNTGANENINDPRVIQGEFSVHLLTNLSAFQLVMVNPIITSDGVISVAIENQTGQTVVLPDLNFKVIKI